ncbi:MAG: NFACT family protein [Candidatus Riflebacteria bacterium]|nr:NFACT family protein [Candidatus Riflebacteria bacterium]
MDYWVLKKQVREISLELVGTSFIQRVFDLPNGGIAFLFKTRNGLKCGQFFSTGSEQGMVFSENVEESEVKHRFASRLDSLLHDAKIKDVTLHEWDRLVKFHLIGKENFFGKSVEFFFNCEFTGRIGNLLLLDSKRVVIDQERNTENNSPGNPYFFFLPANDLIDPFKLSESEIDELMAKPPAVLQSKLLGFTPLFAREYYFRQKNPSGFVQSNGKLFSSLLTDASEGRNFYVYYQEGRIKALSVFKLFHLLPICEEKKFESVNSGTAWFYESIKKPEKVIKLREKALSSYNSRLKKVSKALEEENERLTSFKRVDEYRHFGDLLFSVIREIKPWSREISVLDWESGKNVNIPLDPELSGPKNAERYYKMYQKSQRGVIETKKRIQELENEKQWIEEQIWFCETLENASELENTFFVSPKKQKKSQFRLLRETRKAKLIKPLFENENCRFFVGKSGKQNDLITFGVGNKGDLWAHALEVPGCHVIAKAKSGIFSEKDAYIAAVLAAKFSFARNSGKVAVDITDVANVHRVPGGGPGRVFYTNQKTLFVNPAEVENLEELSKQF